MLDIALPLPLPTNEPILGYLPGSAERAALKAALGKMAGETAEVPHTIGGKELRQGDTFDVRAPHDRSLLLAKCHSADAAVAQKAIDAALAAAPMWARTTFDERARIFQRAADLLAGPWRQILNAATMLGQSKTLYQSEIDAACELVDFLRFNVYFASRLVEQPVQAPNMKNALELRPLEGFVLAVTPFNFTAIGGNLPTSPAIMGNVVVWKPAHDQGLAAYYTMKLFEAAGLPPGVINVVYGGGAVVGPACIKSPDLAGVHFTGSTGVFQDIWRGIGERIASYKSYPRIVGETGGKDFVFAHPSADPDGLVAALVRGAYEYQGQKCSAASRAYVPESLWPRARDRMVAEIEKIKMGDVRDFRNMMGAVINERSFTKLSKWHERAKQECKVHTDKGWSKEKGFFCGPTLVEVSDPKHPIMQEELFGPILSVWAYKDKDVEATLDIVNTTSPYALTGAIWAQDRTFVKHAAQVLRQAAGNFYINDKPTGAVVGQQPFGGARASGTNDKAGSAFNLLRWASPRTVKENFVPPTVVPYPYMTEE